MHLVKYCQGPGAFQRWEGQKDFWTCYGNKRAFLAGTQGTLSLPLSLWLSLSVTATHHPSLSCQGFWVLRTSSVWNLGRGFRHCVGMAAFSLLILQPCGLSLYFSPSGGLAAPLWPLGAPLWTRALAGLPTSLITVTSAPAVLLASSPSRGIDSCHVFPSLPLLEAPGERPLMSPFLPCSKVRPDLLCGHTSHLSSPRSSMESSGFPGEQG